MSMTFQLTILGSGSATPLLGRHPTAQLLEIDSDYFLVDCGEGTQFRLLEQRIRPGRLRYIFISHLHGDHYFGLAPLLSSLNLAGRTEELYLFGPAGLLEILTVQFRHSDTRLGYPLHFQPVEPGRPGPILDLPQLTVESIPLEHRIDCSGYLFREKPRKRKLIKEKLPADMPIDYLRRLKDGQDIVDEAGNVLFRTDDYSLPAPPPRSYAFCSDTRYTEKFLQQIAGISLLYHETTFLDDQLARAGEVFHATARQAATLATKAGVQQLLIGHFSSRYKQTEGFLEEARSVFPETYLATEGHTFPVGSAAL